MELIAKKEFVATAFDLKDKIFRVHAAFLASSNDIHLFCKVQIASLKVNEAFTTVFLEYFDFADIFSPKLAVEFSEYTKINNHTIDLINGKQSFYRPIYNLKLVKLEILKTYIKTNLVNNFIRSSKSLANALILFV